MEVQDNIIFYPLMGVVTTGIVVEIKTEIYLIYQTQFREIVQIQMIMNANDGR